VKRFIKKFYGIPDILRLFWVFIVGLIFIIIFGLYYDPKPFIYSLVIYFVSFVGIVIVSLPEVLSKILKKNIDIYGIERENSNKMILYRTIYQVTRNILGYYEFLDENGKQNKSKIKKWIDDEFKLDSDNIMHWVEQKLPESAPVKDDNIVLQYDRIIEDSGIDRDNITLENLLDFTKLLLLEFNSEKTNIYNFINDFSGDGALLDVKMKHIIDNYINEIQFGEITDFNLKNYTTQELVKLLKNVLEDGPESIKKPNARNNFLNILKILFNRKKKYQDNTGILFKVSPQEIDMVLFSSDEEE